GSSNRRTLATTGLQVVHLVRQGLGGGHCCRRSLPHWPQGKVLRLRKAEHTAPIGWLNVIGNAGEPRDLVGAATVVPPHGPMTGLLFATDVTKVELPWAQAQPMRLALCACCPRLNFFARRGTWHVCWRLPILDQYIVQACTNGH